MRDYGVVIDEEKSVVDDKATKDLREKAKASGGR
jgi:hypothetical protein